MTNEAILPLTKLTTLCLFNCQLFNDDALVQLPQLTDLDIAYVEPVITGRSVSQLTNLTKLNLRGEDYVLDEVCLGVSFFII
jgi:hypothetical protein